MCLTIPGKIEEIKEGVATVSNDSRTAQVDLGLVFDAKVGDWILYATDRAVKRISEEDAKEIISLLEDHYHPVDVSKLSLKFKKIIFKVRSRDNKNQESRIKNYGESSLSEAGLSNRKTTSNVILSEAKNLAKRSDSDTAFGLDPSAMPQDDERGVQDDKESARDHNNGTMEQWSHDLTKEEIEYLLNLKGESNLETLYAEANSLRKEMIEDFICIHGIIEFSNYCKNNCLYCGIRYANDELKRYRMTKGEIVAAAKEAVEKEGYKLIVLQSGEDDHYSDEEILEIIREIKKQLRVFIFISVGERSKQFYKKAFKAGASGSLYRFETSNPALYKKLRPGHRLEDRLSLLEYQKKLGYYMATGSMVGLPGQTISDIADDLLMIKKLGIPMISAGPWLPASGTPVARCSGFEVRSSDRSSVFGLRSPEEKIELFLKFIAVARFMMPEIKIPVTTALETLDPKNGRHRGLLAGANALMFNLTPSKVAENYNIYDNKYREREKVWQKYGLFQGEESYEMLEDRLKIDLAQDRIRT